MNESILIASVALAGAVVDSVLLSAVAGQVRAVTDAICRAIAAEEDLVRQLCRPIFDVTFDHEFRLFGVATGLWLTELTEDEA
jgi:hypothetical protein